MIKILQFKITLLDSEPLIYRHFQVTDDYRMDRFHQVIQIVMGWNNSHLHEFYYKDRKIGMLIPEEVIYEYPDLEDETTLFLNDLSLNVNDEIRYLYDFGDSWDHLIKLEKIEDAELIYPVCLKGKKAGPIDDTGGVWGYRHFVERLNDSSNPDYLELEEWKQHTGFDPDIFPLDKVNMELERFGAWHRKHPHAKSTPWHMI